MLLNHMFQKEHCIGMNFQYYYYRHLVSTPIGCMDDISARAINVLKNVDIILAEDTRTTGFLLTQ